MRLAIAFAATCLLAAPGLAQEPAEESPAEESVWATPEISSDISALPEAVQATRQKLIDAARSGDIEALQPIIDAQGVQPKVSFGDPDDALGYLRDVSEDGEGRQILGLLLDLLDQPYAYFPDSGGETNYIWPYLAELDPNALTPEQQVDAYRLVSDDQLDDLKQFGAWIFWRTYINESGEWYAFIAGD